MKFAAVSCLSFALALALAGPALAQQRSQSELAQASADELAAAARARATNPNRPVQWWPEVRDRPDTWFRGDQARVMAENILSWQDKSVGGWPLMNTTGEAFTGDLTRAGPWGTRAALIKATVNEIRFLSRMYQATGEPRYRTALTDGLSFILRAQYPSGGWPHSYPLRDDYSRYATYNDDMMPDLMRLLDEVANEPLFDWMDPADRARAQAAFDRGVDFILKSQIRVDGQLTAWGQQHDEVTYQPRAARNFEPAAISGGESASVLLLLMGIENPSPEVVQAIEAGVAWYRRSQIEGIDVVTENGDRFVRADPDAAPMWARFYEIPTNRPIFAGRDSIIRYSMAEIEQERRAGYAWYNRSGAAVFREYERWRTARGR